MRISDWSADVCSSDLVVANEIDAFALAAIRLNAEANGLEAGLELAGRDMLDDPVQADDGGPLWDVVLAGDVSYEKPMEDRVAAWLIRPAARGALVLMGGHGRQYLPAVGPASAHQYLIPTAAYPKEQTARTTCTESNG